MATIIPFAPSIPFYRFATTLDNVEYVFDVRWNGRDEAWYFDVSEADGTAIASGLKIVLGTYFGRWVEHPLFREGVIVAVDLSDAGVDAKFDDLGTRVVVMRMGLEEVLSLRVTATFPDAAELAKL